MVSLSEASVNHARLCHLASKLGWDVNIASKPPVLNEDRLGTYRHFEYEYNDDITVRAHVFDRGLTGPEVHVYSRQHGTLLDVRSLLLEHTISAIKEVLAWADETSRS